MRKILSIIFAFLLFVINSYALTVGSKYWLNTNLSGNLFNDPKLLYMTMWQYRGDLPQNKFEVTHLIGSVGYQYFPDVSFWLGYQWTSENQINGNNSENRMWQQIIWRFYRAKYFNSSLFSRLEELKRTTQLQWHDRQRERLILKFPNVINDDVTPCIYNEVFLNFSNPAWINTNKFVDQNRFFSGIDLKTTRHSYLEMGYMNQYIWRNNGNTMNHILSITLFINTN